MGQAGFSLLTLLAVLAATLPFESRAQIAVGNGTYGLSSITAENTERYQSPPNEDHLRQARRRNLQNAEKITFCDPLAKDNADFKQYFDGMKTIYREGDDNTCLPAHRECGWAAINEYNTKKLPLLVLSVGLEGAGHHLWTELLNEPVFDCVWVNARHYRREIGDGVPRTTSEELSEGFH